MRRGFLLCLLLLLPFVTVEAYQSLTEDAACSAVVQQAVLIVDAVCAETGRNQACYGNNHVEAAWREDALSSPFDQPGHRVDVSTLSRLQTLPLSLEDAEWGVSLIKAQVDLPDALPGTNSLFLLFGDATLTPSSRSPVPMQVFRLETGITGLRCQEAAANGLLIQTPPEAGEIAFMINGVNVRLGSTVFLQAQAGGVLGISTIEGSARMRAEDVEQVALAGWRVEVPMTDELAPAGAPTVPEPYDEALIAVLPLELLEEDDILTLTATPRPPSLPNGGVSGGSGQSGQAGQLPASTTAGGDNDDDDDDDGDDDD
jgi:hypothetical protein